MKRDYQWGTDILPEYSPEKLEDFAAKLSIWLLKTIPSPVAFDLEVRTNMEDPERTRDSIFIKLTPKDN